MTAREQNEFLQKISRIINKIPRIKHDTEIPDAIAGVRPTLLLENHSLTIAGTNVLAQTLVTAKA